MRSAGVIGPRPSFGVLSAAAVMVGMVVGVGIFTFPAMVAARAPNEWAFLGLWLAGGGVAVIGALCYGELAARHPDAGGEYHFLTRAYGQRVGFLFGWTRMIVIQAGSIAVAAAILGDHASRLWSLGPHGTAVYAALAVTGLTYLHWRGTTPSKRAQGVLTVAVVTLLVAAALLALVMPAERAIPAATDTGGDASLGAAGMAMVFVLLTYGGWNETVYLTGEMRDPGRTVLKALALGIGVVTGTYLLVNVAYLQVLGFGALGQATTPGADLIAQAVGATAGDGMACLVVLAALSTINAAIMTGGRTNYALGRDFPFMGALGRWDERRNCPGPALVVQGGITLALIGFGVVSRQSTIEMLVAYTAPVFWFFLMLVGGALLVFRRRADGARGTPPSFRVPMYPLVPLAFIGICGLMVYASLLSFGTGAWLGVAILASGLVVLAVGRRFAEWPRPDEQGTSHNTENSSSAENDTITDPQG